MKHRGHYVVRDSLTGQVLLRRAPRVAAARELAWRGMDRYTATTALDTIRQRRTSLHTGQIDIEYVPGGEV